MKNTKNLFLIIMGLTFQSNFLAMEAPSFDAESFKITQPSSHAAQKSLFQRFTQHLTDRFNDWKNGKSDLIKTFTNHAADTTTYIKNDAPRNLNEDPDALNLNLTEDQQIRFKKLSTKGKQDVIDAWNKKHEEIASQKLQNFKEVYAQDLHIFNIDAGQRLRTVIKNEEESIKNNKKEIETAKKSLTGNKTPSLKNNILANKIEGLKSENKIRENLIENNTNLLEQGSKDRFDNYNRATANFTNLHNAKRTAFANSINNLLNSDLSSTQSTTETESTVKSSLNYDANSDTSDESSVGDQEPETVESLQKQIDNLKNQLSLPTTDTTQKGDLIKKMMNLSKQMAALPEFKTQLNKRMAKEKKEELTPPTKPRYNDDFQTILNGFIKKRNSDTGQTINQPRTNLPPSDFETKFPELYNK